MNTFARFQIQGVAMETKELKNKTSGEVFKKILPVATLGLTIETDCSGIVLNTPVGKDVLVTGEFRQSYRGDVDFVVDNVEVDPKGVK